MPRTLQAAIIAALFVLAVSAQQPGKGPVPQQLPLEAQNEIMKAQLDAQDVLGKYNQTGCAETSQKANVAYQADQAKITEAITKGLKSMGLDPAKYEVNQGTFYVTSRPAPAVPATKK
jgi:hypothetical protein